MWPSPLYALIAHVFRRKTGKSFFKYVFLCYLVIAGIPALLGAGGPGLQLLTSLGLICTIYWLTSGEDESR